MGIADRLKVRLEEEFSTVQSSISRKANFVHDIYLGVQDVPLNELSGGNLHDIGRIRISLLKAYADLKALGSLRYVLRKFDREDVRGKYLREHAAYFNEVIKGFKPIERHWVLCTHPEVDEPDKWLLEDLREKYPLRKASDYYWFLSEVLARDDLKADLPAFQRMALTLTACLQDLPGNTREKHIRKYSAGQALNTLEQAVQEAGRWDR